MKKALLGYAALAIVLAAICCGLLFTYETYRTTIPAYSSLSDITVRVTGDDIVSATLEPNAAGTSASIAITSRNAGAGEAEVEVSGIFDAGTADATEVSYVYCAVVLDWGLLIVDGCIPGGTFIVVFAIIYLAALAVGLAAGFARRARRGLLCSYQTVAYLALFIFTAASALAFSYQLWMLVSGDFGYSISEFLSTITSLATVFAWLALPVVAIAAVFLVISNIALIRHEGARPTNMLGIAAGVLAALVYLAIFALDSTFWDCENVFEVGASIAIPYLVNFCETVFIATVICGIVAARNKPRLDKDYVIVLGCGIRADGTPTPLLAARTQRALDFAREQAAQTGAMPTIVCSGGQGPDEVVSEAESIAGHLREQGLDSAEMLLENKSTSTQENMEFSREVIRAHFGETASRKPRIAYSTTNYHVFRAGTFALRAGLDAEGMGAQTKWYFWPNAFLREFVGFAVSAKGAVAIAVVAIIAFSLGIASLDQLLIWLQS